MTCASFLVFDGGSTLGSETLDLDSLESKAV